MGERSRQECYERAIQVQDRAFIEACSGGPAGVPWQETVRLAECLDLFRCSEWRKLMKIGFAGIGIMGAPMALNLIKAGHELHIYQPVGKTM